MQKSDVMLRVFSISVLLLLAAFGIACSNKNLPTGDTPTEAYKRLYAAVKSNDTNAIKNEMSKQSVALVGSIAAMQKKPIEDIYANGLTGTLHSETLPEIRDERVNGEMGAIEVYNSTGHKWDDVPFVLEDGKWKLGIGDEWNGKYKSPGKGRDQKEKEAANALSTSQNQPSPGTNSNISVPVGNNLPTTRPKASTNTK